MATSRTGGQGGHPVPIVMKSQTEHTYSLNTNALEEILLQEHLEDCNVVVVSVTGALRRGKSFLLDFMLRYLRFMYKSEYKSNTFDWLGDENSELNGFSWSGGSDGNTTGILMWSEIFSTTLPNGEKVAIVLLDTQGTFDNESTMRDCTTVFALSTLLSSIQIYNLSRDIQGDDLRHLELFMEYGCLALEGNRNKPFQKLQFLIRDWSYPYETNYGLEGGRQVLDKKLKISENSELNLLRENIRSCFADIQCYLMPHPGKKVATDPKFVGRLTDIDDEFKKCLKELIPLLLSRENLIPKKICGQGIKVKKFVDYFKKYMNLFTEEGRLPEPRSILKATAEVHNSSAVDDAVNVYCELMLEICDELNSSFSADEFELKHQSCRRQAVEKFDERPKLGGDFLSRACRLKFEQKIDEFYERLRAQNAKRYGMKLLKDTVISVLGVAVTALTGFAWLRR